MAPDWPTVRIAISVVSIGWLSTVGVTYTCTASSCGEAHHLPSNGYVTRAASGIYGVHRQPRDLGSCLARGSPCDERPSAIPSCGSDGQLGGCCFPGKWQEGDPSWSSRRYTRGADRRASCLARGARRISKVISLNAWVASHPRVPTKLTQIFLGPLVRFSCFCRSTCRLLSRLEMDCQHAWKPQLATGAGWVGAGVSCVSILFPGFRSSVDSTESVSDAAEFPYCRYCDVPENVESVETWSSKQCWAGNPLEPVTQWLDHGSHFSESPKWQERLPSFVRWKRTNRSNIFHFYLTRSGEIERRTVPTPRCLLCSPSLRWSWISECTQRTSQRLWWRSCNVSLHIQRRKASYHWLEGARSATSEAGVSLKLVSNIFWTSSPRRWSWRRLAVGAAVAAELWREHSFAPHGRAVSVWRPCLRVVSTLIEEVHVRVCVCQDGLIFSVFSFNTMTERWRSNCAPLGSASRAVFWTSYFIWEDFSSLPSSLEVSRRYLSWFTPRGVDLYRWHMTDVDSNMFFISA